MRGKGNRKSSGLVLVILIMMVFLSVCKKPERIIAFITLETRVEDISYNTASLRGEIIDPGSQPVDEYGIVYSTDPNPRIGNGTAKAAGSSLKKGEFSISVTGLNKNTKYYFRAYVIIDDVERHADDIYSFTTKDTQVPVVTAGTVSNISRTSASLAGEVTSDGGEAGTIRGLCWGSAANPTIENCIDTTINGSGSGQFTGVMNGLVAGERYYARVYARNSKGTRYNDTDVIFKTHDLPEVTTASVSGITSTGAVSGGNVIDDGEVQVTARGVCWSTSSGPTSDLPTKTVDGSGKGTFVSTITGLSAGVTYYVRAYATNLYGTSYGTELVFSTIGTSPATNITALSATSGGSIYNDGGDPIIERGVCWSTNQNPTKDDSHTSDGTGTGTFTSQLSQLTPATLYYVRAYATNSIATSYGNQVSFSTRNGIPTFLSTTVSSITANSALFSVNITDDGGANILTRGVCWSTSSNPTTGNNYAISGSGTGSFSVNASGLMSSTQYYYRAFSTSTLGTAYGMVQSFITLSNVPILSTTTISGLTSNSASSGGSISSDGGSAIIAKGVCWSTTANPTTADQKTTDGTGTASFTSSITGLAPGTTYHVRAYATNSSGTGYGADLTFTTAAVLPTVTTSAVTSITNISATCGGNVTNSGGATVIIKGVCWSTSPDPTTADPKSNDGSGTGAFSSSITGLSAGTTYYVRAYATNSAGTAYGAQVSFTTINPATTIFSIIGSETGWSTDVDLTLTGTSNTISTYRLASRLFVQGELFKIRKNHDWATNYGYDNLVITGEAANFRKSTDNVEVISDRTYEVLLDVNWLTGGLTLNMNNLTPALSTTAASSISFLTAQTGGNVTSQGSSSVTAKGVCWSTGPKPSVSGPKTYDGTGTGSFVSSLSGLIPDTTYYIRAYATNSSGTSYGNELTFTTLSQVADIDGNTYNVVLIGSQLWMKENLAFLPTVSPSSSGSLSLATYYVNGYQGTNVTEAKATANFNIYGVLYNLPAAATACPTGWHLPSDSEWEVLATYLGGSGIAGGKVKEAGFLHWSTPNTGATNESGFNALPAGIRTIDGNFNAVMGESAYFWSSTAVNSITNWGQSLLYSDAILLKDDFNNNHGLSVRCIKD
jgi:uncharacterized protein (TIGR02145 family)